MSGRLVVGVVGPPGSGKSTVARLLAGRGARVLDADKLGHKLLARGTHEYRRVVDLFGDRVLANDGSIDRDRLAGLVFENRTLLEKLNSVLHPTMVRMIRREMDLHRKGEGGPEPVLVIDAALLVEWGLEDELDVIVGVRAPQELRARRLKDLRGWSLEELRRREEAQWPEEQKTTKTTVLVDNTGTMDDLDDQIIHLWQILLARITT